ncbi:MAG: hybrid sensor histidine kinase/response regulator [Gemmatimonadetes bacterium]|nr:MAG: hybrid sensor histidine kinase/response regulator [Gemmatimonadota bacterium]
MQSPCDGSVCLTIPLRVLIAEDSEDDALLIVRELKRGGYDPTYERVATAAAMAAALERERWDLVIGDHSMPHFSGTGALALVRGRGLDVPFICVSGTISEEMAVAAMRAGANDWVTKGQLKRLIPAIERELREAKGRAALRASETGYETLVEHAPVGIYRSSPEGRFLSVNAALVRILGYDSAPQVLQLDMARDVYADSAERQRLLDRDSYTDREYDEVEATWKRRDGRLLTVQLSVRAVRNADRQVHYYETFVRDVTEQRRLQQQLVQSQKMEAVGRLAGGIAHDFNNLLTVITTYCDLLLEDLAREDPKRDDVEQVRKAADGAAALTRQLLAFSRQQVVEPRVVSLNTVVEGLQKILRRVIGEDIDLAITLAPDLGAVRADVGQLEQVLMNLAVNARDAMPTGGRLTIETANVEHDPDYARDQEAAAVRRFAMLAVSDTGCGMDEATKARIFEPFFTTKEPGKGTGLGLATVYGIVNQAGGFIWVYSEPDQGTSFKVYLPEVDATAERPTAVPGARVPGGTETVLLVEDAAAVRAVTKQVLERQGYKVLEAADGEAALQLAQRHRGPIDLLLTDVVMPRLSGRELAGQFARLRPDTRVLYASGYTDDSVVRHGILESGTAYLQKPFSPESLARKVRDVLDAR